MSSGKTRKNLASNPQSVSRLTKKGKVRLYLIVSHVLNSSGAEIMLSSRTDNNGSHQIKQSLAESRSAITDLVFDPDSLLLQLL